jgi:RNA polymerase sigma factor (sigma-70 family)
VLEHRHARPPAVTIVDPLDVCDPPPWLARGPQAPGSIGPVVERASSSHDTRDTAPEAVTSPAPDAAGEPAPAFLDALRRGEDDTLPALVDRYGPRIYNFPARMCRNDEDAKDVLQETLIAVVRSVKDFRGEGKLSTWLFRIAANVCRKMRRRGKFEPAHHLPLEAFLPTEDEKARLGTAGETLEAALLRTDLRDTLEAGIVALPPTYRAVLILRDLEGLSTAETAEALGLTTITVKVRLHRARLALRQRLATLRLGPDEPTRPHVDRTDGRFEQGRTV